MRLRNGKSYEYVEPEVRVDKTESNIFYYVKIGVLFGVAGWLVPTSTVVELVRYFCSL
jgi:hypothetical protein